jgi:hypothetical protein
MNFWCLFSFCKNTIVITFSLDVSCYFRGRPTITTNVWRLGEGGGFTANVQTKLTLEIYENPSYE